MFFGIAVTAGGFSIFMFILVHTYYYILIAQRKLPLLKDATGLNRLLIITEPPAIINSKYIQSLKDKVPVSPFLLSSSFLLKRTKVVVRSSIPDKFILVTKNIIDLLSTVESLMVIDDTTRT